MPHNIQTRVPVLSRPVLPITERNPACSYQNSTYMVPLQNEIQYKAGDMSTVFPMATIKSLTLTQTSFQPYQPQSEAMTVELPHWEEQIYPNQSTINYPCSISNYLPVETQFQRQPYPWFGPTTVIPNNTPANLCLCEQFLPPNCDKICCTPCKQNY